MPCRIALLLEVAACSALCTLQQTACNVDGVSETECRNRLQHACAALTLACSAAENDSSVSLVQLSNALHIKVSWPMLCLRNIY